MRLGVRLFAAMLWISAVGYAMFPLPQPGAPAGFQGTMHLVVTGAVVTLSVAALGLIIYGALIKKACLFLGWSALIALIMMLCGAVGTGVLPTACFGIPERFSVFAAALFNAARCGAVSGFSVKFCKFPGKNLLVTLRHGLQ